MIFRVMSVTEFNQLHTIFRFLIIFDKQARLQLKYNLLPLQLKQYDRTSFGWQLPPRKYV